MKRWLMWLLLVMAPAAVANGQVELRFAPGDTTLSAGETCRLSVWTSQSLPIRTIDVTVTYDTGIVQSQGGGAGALYAASGIYTFDGFEEPAAGQWHGYAVLMGAGLSIHGPGELFYWNLKALADGTCPVTTVSVYVSMTDGSWYNAVDLPPGSIRVGRYTSQVEQTRPARAAAVELWPNPFNPRTAVGCTVPVPGVATVTVFDPLGRRVARLFDGLAGEGSLRLEWDGRGDDGAPQAAGTYLFVVKGRDYTASAKGLLVK